MLGCDTVAHVAAAEVLHRGQDLLHLVEIAHRRGEHAHQLLFLLRQVVRKKPADLWRDGEEAVVEDVGRLRGDGLDQLEALLHELHLFRRHEANSVCVGVTKGEAGKEGRPGAPASPPCPITRTWAGG